MKEFDPSQRLNYHTEKLDQLAGVIADTRWFEHHAQAHGLPFKHVYRDTKGERQEIVIDREMISILHGAASGLYAELRTDKVAEVTIFSEKNTS